MLDFLTGGGRSSSSTDTTNSLRDNRQVHDASGGGVIGQGHAHISYVDGDAKTARLQSRTATKTTGRAVREMGRANHEAIGFSAGAAAQAFDLARDSQAQAHKSSSEAIGAVINAFKAAKGDKTEGGKVMMLALVVGGAVAVAFALRRS